MKKKLIISFLLITILLFSSCSLGGSRTAMLNRDNDEGKADARLEQLIEAITNRDKDALRAMFSQQALSEAEDIDGRMDYLFNFFQGKVLTWDDEGLTASEKKHNGNKTKEVKSFYTVETDHPDNVGLYMLQVIKAEDRDTQFDFGQKTLCAGIYKPSAQDDSSVLSE